MISKLEMERMMNQTLLIALVESSLTAAVNPSAASENDGLAETENESSYSARREEFQAAYWAGVAGLKQLLSDDDKFASLKEIFESDPSQFEFHLERAFDTAYSKSRADPVASLPLSSPTPNSNKDSLASFSPCSPDRRSKTVSLTSSGSSHSTAEVTPSPEWPKIVLKRPCASVQGSTDRLPDVDHNSMVSPLVNHSNVVEEPRTPDRSFHEDFSNGHRAGREFASQVRHGAQRDYENLQEWTELEVDDLPCQTDVIIGEKCIGEAAVQRWRAFVRGFASAVFQIDEDIDFNDMAYHAIKRDFAISMQANHGESTRVRYLRNVDGTFYELGDEKVYKTVKESEIACMESGRPIVKDSRQNTMKNPGLRFAMRETWRDRRKKEKKARANLFLPE